MYSKMPTKPKISIFFRFGLPTILHPKVTGVLIEKTLMHIFSKLIRLFEVNQVRIQKVMPEGIQL